MILRSLSVSRSEFEAGTGWSIKPEGACKGDVCVPLPAGARGEQVDVPLVASHLGMPLVHDEAGASWCLGPAALGRALNDAHAPELILPDASGRRFDLASLHGQKVLLVAWASW